MNVSAVLEAGINYFRGFKAQPGASPLWNGGLRFGNPPRKLRPAIGMRIANDTRVAYMWSATEITVEIDAVDHSVMIVTIAVPIGVLEIIGSVTRIGRKLRIDGAHVQGLMPGALGRASLNAIGRKLLEEADVDEIIIQGGARTTGRRKGKIPQPIRFPR